MVPVSLAIGILGVGFCSYQIFKGIANAPEDNRDNILKSFNHDFNYSFGTYNYDRYIEVIIYILDNPNKTFTENKLIEKFGNRYYKEISLVCRRIGDNKYNRVFEINTNVYTNEKYYRYNGKKYYERWYD